MKQRALILATMLAILSALTAGCGWNPLGIPTHFEVETTSELGSNTLSRIDDLNDVLERGVEVGPETRGTIEELNETIRDGIRFGFTEDSLERVDRLLAIVEQGVGIEVGLDAETNATVNELIDTIDQAPDDWESTATEIIEALEGSTSAVAGQMADEVRSLMTEARLNTQQVSASVGAEFRCNVDFLGARAGDTVNQFIGRTIVGRLRSIISGEPEEEEATPVPWVCQIIPDQIDLVQVEDRLVFETAVVKISGYNYVVANTPLAYLVDEAGQRIDSTPLYPFLSSPYQIQLNLQSIDFSAIPERSRVVFEWPSAGTSYALAMVFPTEEIPPAEVVQAELTITTPSVDVRRGPSTSYNVFGRLEVGTIALVTGRNGDSSWWQIDFEGDDGWVPASAGTRNEIEVLPVAIPVPLPVAAFDMDPSSGGDAPLEVQFINRSTGSPTHLEWDFGGGLPSAEQNPTHVFETAGTYQVRLRAENDLGTSSVTRTFVVTQPVVLQPLQPLRPFNPVFPGLLVSSPFSDGSVFFRTFPSLGEHVHYNTGIPTSTYECGVVGMAANSGDIHESGTDNIIYAFLAEEAGTWWINADFHTHENSEDWDIFVMCLNRSATDGYEFYRRVQVRPEDTDTVSLEDLGIPDGWHCGVVGIAAWSGDINENGTGAYIIEAFVQQDSSGEWELTSNFQTHVHEEYWDVDVLCVDDDPEVFLHQGFYSREGGAVFDTNIPFSDYICGIDGFAARNGDINEDGTGDIIRAYAYLVGGSLNWMVIPDFRSHYVHERWDIQLLCVRRPIAVW
jgi:PKD repeat protein